MIGKPHMQETEPHLEKFERFEKEAKQPSWVFPLRKAGIARFAEQGFPTINDEDWRFTNVAPITKLPFKPVFAADRDGIDAETVAGFTFGQIPAHPLVFVNGPYVSDLSSPPSTLRPFMLSLAEAQILFHIRSPPELACPAITFAPRWLAKAWNVFSTACISREASSWPIIT